MRIGTPEIALRRHLLHGLAEGSRLRILTALRGGERRVGDLVDATGLTQPNVSKHLRCLRGCGLVERDRRGREVYYRPADGVSELLEAIDRVLEVAAPAMAGCAHMAGTLEHGAPR